MTITECSNPRFSRSKGIISSASYVIALTGTRAIIFTHELHFLGEISGLDYVYKGSVAPDERTLLLVSNGNVFYLVSLETFSIIGRKRLSGEYNNNLEGRGFWSIDGSSVYIVASRASNNTIRSCLFQYRLPDLIQIQKQDWNSEFKIMAVASPTSFKKHLLAGYHEGVSINDQKMILVWYDERIFEVFTISDTDLTIHRVEYDEDSKNVILYGDGTVICDVTGHVMQNIPSSYLGQRARFSGIPSLLPISTQQFDQIKEISTLLVSEDAPFIEYITDIRLSKNQKYLYVATRNRFCILDAVKKNILHKKVFRFGIEKIHEISDGVLMLTSVDGTKIYKITD